MQVFCYNIELPRANIKAFCFPSQDQTRKRVGIEVRRGRSSLRRRHCERSDPISCTAKWRLPPRFTPRNNPASRGVNRSHQPNWKPMQTQSYICKWLGSVTALAIPLRSRLFLIYPPGPSLYLWVQQSCETGSCLVMWPVIPALRL